MALATLQTYRKEFLKRNKHFKLLNFKSPSFFFNIKSQRGLNVEVEISLPKKSLTFAIKANQMLDDGRNLPDTRPIT